MDHSTVTPFERPRVLHTRRSEERIAYCEDLDKQVADLETFKHAHVAPHNFAVRAVEGEVSWMCDGWVPERKLLLADHLASLKEAMRAYEEQLQCQVGSVPCFRIDGQVVATGAQTPEWWKATLSRHLAGMRTRG